MRVMSLIQTFAHSEQLHNEATSQLEHTLTSPAVAWLLFIILNYLLFQIVLSFRKQALLPVMLGFNFFIGVLGYEAIPAVSIIAISAGITIALVATLGLIADH